MQTFYPVFESGQVLTNGHLNQMFQWLNEQQMASRSKLFGMGIVCGFEVARESNQVLVSGGVALSSIGHLMTQDSDRTYTQYRNYELPVSQAVEDESDIDALTANELLPFSDVALWELLGSDAEAVNGKPMTNLSAGFLQDKVVMLLLEAKQESLKNCDVNSCADKGARMQFTLRTVLISEADAIRFWQAETAQKPEMFPRDLNWQNLEKLLAPAGIRKLVCSATGADSLEQIFTQVQSIINDGWLALRNQLQGSFDVYAYLLRDYFPVEEFPTDPWTGIESTLSTAIQSVEDLILKVHHYDLLVDAVASYNEFIDSAKEYEALCCPSEKRFPFHVLLGKAEPLKHVTQSNQQTPSAVNFGLGAQAGYPYLRHCFYPNPQFEAQHHCGQKVANLYYRTWLIFKRYQVDGLLQKNIEISPSQRYGALSAKALPYYLTVNKGDDLHRNWNPDATLKGALSKVNGYHVNSANPHPLAMMPDNHDFYRIEGLMGKPLGQAIADLRLQKSQLGLSFAIEPVFLPVKSFADDFAKAEMLQVLLQDNTLQRLFKCKISDLDMIFMILIAVLFQLMISILYLLARLSPTTQTTASNDGMGPGDYTAMSRYMVAPSDTDALMAEMDAGAINGSFKLKMTQGTYSQSSEDSSFILKQIKKGTLITDDVLDVLNEEADPNGQAALLYKRTKQLDSGDLYEKVKEVVGGNAAADDLEHSYQSMRMMQESEKLMDKLAVESLAQFDFDGFENSMTELNDAHQKLKQVQEKKKETDQSVAQGIDSQMSMLSTLGQSSMMANLKQEFSKRLESIFTEMLFDGFVKKHPGTEHLCGVPKGGTLILAYTHKSMLDKYVPSSASNEVATEVVATPSASHLDFAHEDLSERAATLMERMAGSTKEKDMAFARMLDTQRKSGKAMTVNDFMSADETVAYESMSLDANSTAANDVRAVFAKLEVGKAAQASDPLNDMIVLMDFCVPTFCCDADCSDLELASKETAVEEEPKPTTVTVSGTIVSASKSPSSLGKKVSTLSGANLEVRDRNNKSVKVTLTRGAFLFKVKTGTYTITASAEGYQTITETTKISQSKSDVVIALKPNRVG